MLDANQHILQDLSKNAAKGNNLCIDCEVFNPQWASVTLECSGVHRSLGVHISFVRSISMDKWSEDQIKRMQFGGNKKCMEFFKAHADWQEGMTIQEKYNSEFSKLYKEKLSAEVEGRPWVMPQARISSPRSSPKAQSNVATSLSSSPLRMNAPPAPKERNEEYFQSLGQANAFKSEVLPPSQGGKYVGFGSAPSDAKGIDTDPLADPLATLSKGWSMFASVALTGLTEGTKLAMQASETIGHKLNESVIEPGTRAVRNPDSLKFVGNFMEKAISGMSTIVKGGTDIVTSAIGIEATRHGFQPDDDHWSNQRHDDDDWNTTAETMSGNDFDAPHTVSKAINDTLNEEAIIHQDGSWKESGDAPGKKDSFDGWGESVHPGVNVNNVGATSEKDLQAEQSTDSSTWDAW